MKKKLNPGRLTSARRRTKKMSLNAPRFAIVSVSLALGCVAAKAQTNAPAASPSNPGGTTNVTQLENLTVIGKLDTGRDQIIPDLGATAHTFTKQQIESVSQGDNAPFNEIILRAPGVAQDSAVNGDLHVRGEHANLQYRINDVLLPEGITGFGLELDPRFVESMQLVTGSLPAAYGFRTAGVVDIHTKSGAFENGGEVGVYGGSFNTLRPSFELGGSQGKWNFFMDGSFDHNDLGIENPAPGHDAIHDTTSQYKSFLYGSRVLDDTSRITVMGSLSYSDFQVPNSPGVAPGNSPTPANPSAVPWWTQMSGQSATSFNSANLNENQNEQNYYGVLTYQKSVDDFNLQASIFGRASSVHFMPDTIGDLYFNGVASDVERTLYSGGLQVDASYALNQKHTLRAGLIAFDEMVQANSTTTVFPVDANGNPTGGTLPPIVNDETLHGIFAGIYLQDEWTILPKVTINYGARFDQFYSSFDHENQPSPRVNLIYTPTDSTTLHAGYARYFTPPPVENVPARTVSEFDGTSNSTGNDQDSPVKAERANYFDAGVSQKVTKHLQVGVDGYYKDARNQLDDGLFGQTLILSAFNYAKGRIYGVEFTGSYNDGGFSAYANVAYSVAQGEGWNSAQFLFGPGGSGTPLAYSQNNWIYLDHDQRVTGSFGASYTWNHSSGSSRVYVDALYGSGLRADGGGFIPGSDNPIPNGTSVPAYYSVNLGAEETFKLTKKQTLKARFDVVNVTDNIYELRNGSGVGVNAAQYGERLGFFGSLSYAF